MNPNLPVIRFTGLSVFVEAYAKSDHAFPVLSLFGAKASAQGIAAALVSRQSEVFLDQKTDRSEVWLSPGEFRIFSRALLCGAHHVLVTTTQALIKSASLPTFFVVDRSAFGERVASTYFSFLDRVVPIPLLPGWSDWLWKRGIEKGEIRELEGFRISVFECSVDLAALKKDLSHALKRKELSLEENRDETGRTCQGRVLPDSVRRR
jgi:hypothetical protein